MTDPSGHLDLDDLGLERGYSPDRAYGNGKLENILFTRELDRRHGADGIAAAAVGTNSARLGDAASTWSDGVLSAVNRIAVSRGVREGMTAKEAARLLADTNPSR